MHIDTESEADGHLHREWPCFQFKVYWPGLGQSRCQSRCPSSSRASCTLPSHGQARDDYVVAGNK